MRKTILSPKFIFLITLFFFNTSFFVFGESKSSNLSKEIPSQNEQKKSIKKNIHAFGEIALNHNGRLKPMSSYAREFLLISATRTKVNGQTATEILSEILFTPEKTFEKKIFRINNEQTKHFFNLHNSKKKYYSFSELIPHFSKLNERFMEISKKKDKQKTPLDRELSRLYHAINNFFLLSKSFTFFIPVKELSITNDSLKKRFSLNTKQTQFSFLEISQNEKLFDYAQKMSLKKSEKYTSEEKEFNRLLQNYIILVNSLRQSPLLLFPLKKTSDSSRSEYNAKYGTKHQSEYTWHTLWEILFAHNHLLHNEQTKLVQDMILDYRKGEFENSYQAIANFQNQTANVIGEKKIKKVNLENFYNNFKPFYKAILLYCLTFLIVLFGILFSLPLLKKISLGTLSIALAFNIFGLIVRILIVGRAPVTNLYETFLFITAICVILAIVIERFFKHGIGILTGSFLGLFLLLTSNQFAVEGDTLGVLVAVLRSNFWLSTHVITITIGYSGVILAGAIAHFYLFHSLKKNTDSKKLKDIYKMTYATLVFGLIFSFVGTILGGIWADQSWGRFWGWDPKENGALLIVLWCSILLHGRISGLIKEIGFCVGSILGIIIVMMSWFGINLLGVGLHSYGFTSGLALNLFLYIWMQLLLLVICLSIIFFKNRPKKTE